MSSGGMDWAYRMIAAHNLDALGVAIVLHLGWRDAPNFRTDRGIARSLNRDRTTIRKATAKLAALGVIVRLSGQWVACETVSIVREAPDAPLPDADHADGGRGSQAPGGHRPPGEGVSVPLKRGSQAPAMRKENLIKGARGASRPSKRAALPANGQAARSADGPEDQRQAPAASVLGAEGLSPFQRSYLLQGKAVLVNGHMLKPGSADFERLASVLRSAA